MTLYRDVIANALRMSWRHRFLWSLGVFVAFAGNSGEYQFFFNGIDSLSGQFAALSSLHNLYLDGTLLAAVQNLPRFASTVGIVTLVFGTLIALAVFVGIIWLILTGLGGLVWALDRLMGDKLQPTTFAQSFAVGRTHFVKLFWANFMLKVIVYGLIFLVTVPLGLAYVQTGRASFEVLYVVSAFIFLIPLAMLVSFIGKYVTMFIVLRNATWRSALRQGWTFFVQNWLVSIEVGLLLFVIVSVLSVVFTYLLLIIGLATNPASFLLFLVLGIVFGAFLAVFQYATWVNLFFQIEKGQARSKILRLVDQWRPPLPAPAQQTKPATKTR